MPGNLVRPSQCVRGYFSDSWKNTNLKFVARISRVQFRKEISFSHEIIAFLVVTVLCKDFMNFCLHFKNYLMFSNKWLFHIEDRHKTYQNHHEIHFEGNLYRVNFFYKINRFLPHLFSENWEGVYLLWLVLAA